MNRRTDRDLTVASLNLSHIAGSISDARIGLHTHLARLDGYPGGGERLGVTATAELTTVEQSAQRRIALSTLADELDHARQHAISAVYALARKVEQAQRLTAQVPPESPALCCNGQGGKEGVVEWGDPLCVLPAVKGGMCQMHYQRWYRHRQELGIDTSRDFQPGV
jgi:hypothetical protein